MKKKKLGNKLAAVVLSCAMAMSLTACGGSSKSPDAGTDAPAADSSTAETDAKQTESTAGEASSEAAEASYLPEAKDLGGRTIKIGVWWDIFYESGYDTLDDITAAGGTFDNAETAQMQLDAVHQVEERWNCKIDYVNLGWDGIMDSIATSVTAGTPDCDIYFADLQFGISPVMNGYAQKLSEIAPADADVLNDETIFTRFNLLGSDDYLFTNTSEIPSGALYMAYNAEMLDSLNLEAPEKLAERGEWTWDKFEEYIDALTQDTDGDGNIDVYGYSSIFTNTIQGFCASNNAQIAASTTEGLSDPKTVEVFNLIDRMYNVNGTARPLNQDDWDDNWNGLFSGKYAFSFVQPYMLIAQLDTHDFDVRICPAPIGPSGDGSMTAPQVTNYYFIPVGVEDPTSVYMVWEELNNWFKGDTSYRDNPDWFMSAFVDEDQLELAYKEGYKANSDIWNSIPGMDIGAVFYSIAVNKDASVSQAIESNKQLVQDALDALTK